MTVTCAMLPGPLGEIGALRRGACPSLATPMRTGDGLLVRLRPTAAALTAHDLLALADLARAHGNGLLEITARGNLQLRGLTDASVPHLAVGLAAAGIVPQTGVAIEVPPLAGIDPSELADAAPFADALRAALADAALVLAPKLAVVVDGGGVLSLADMVADIRLDAVAGTRGLAWRLSLGGDRMTARAVALLPGEKAVDGVMTVAAALAAIGPAARGRDLDPTLLAAALGAAPVPPIPVASPVHPLGVHGIGDETVLGLAPAYGQIHADRLVALVQDLAGCGATEYRLAPHHTLLVRGLRAETLSVAQASAVRANVWSTQDAPGRAISVCAGSAGCASASVDTHAVADTLVAEVGDLLDGSFDIHVSGCPKGCAHPAAAAVTLCGTAAGIGLVLGGRAGDAASAILPANALQPALNRLGTLLRTRCADGETTGDLIGRTAPATLVSAYQGPQ